MPDLALVNDGVLIAVARNTADPAVFGQAPAGNVVAFDDGAAVVGMLWDGEALSDPPPPEPEPPSVPAFVSMRQARLALLGAGLLDTVETLMAGQPQAVQIEWEYATDVWRDRDLVVTLGAALGLTDQQIDDLFITARAIP